MALTAQTLHSAAGTLLACKSVAWLGRATGAISAAIGTLMPGALVKE